MLQSWRVSCALPLTNTILESRRAPLACRSAVVAVMHILATGVPVRADRLIEGVLVHRPPTGMPSWLRSS